MIRQAAYKHFIETTQEFRFRGKEPGRLENLSDGVFSLAIALLLISTTPPGNVAQIKRFAWDLIPFTACIALFILIWNQHLIFFFRYGLRNTTMMILNTAFLIIVLFYVYPLKYLAQFILLPLGYLFNQTELVLELKGRIEPGDMADLMIIYGLGAMSIFFVLALMYRYALKKHHDLELTTIELFDTKVSMITNLIMGAVPLLSVLLAMLFYNNWRAGMLAGFAYFLYTPVMIAYGRIVDKRRNRLLSSERL